MNRDTQVSVSCTLEARLAEAEACAQALGTSVSTTDAAAPYRLVFDRQVYLERARSGRILVDFCGGKLAHRRKWGGGKGQMIAKAAGLNHGFLPSVFDATAGLGADAFVLASLGCRVTMAERSPVAFALLQDGLQRAREFALQEDEELLATLERMTLVAGDSLRYMTDHPDLLADVIYLDPMFPPRSKSAAVKKDMQAFHDVIGEDEDSGALLQVALSKARYRVVVKRPRLAGALAGQMPGFSFAGKSSRYDIYVLKGIVNKAAAPVSG